MKMNLDFRVNRSARRTIAIYVNRKGKIEVRAPHLAPKFLIDRFVKSKAGWIRKQQTRVNKQPVPGRTFADGDLFLYLGENLILKKTAATEISVNGKTLLFPRALSFRITRELPDWYKRQAKSVITDRVKVYEPVTGTRAVSITFSDTISKWGSCTPDNRLQFNWRLVMAPLLVIDYVVVHELVHTRIKNHSRAFWNEVEKFKPAHKQYRKWLTRHAMVLQEHFSVND